MHLIVDNLSASFAGRVVLTVPYASFRAGAINALVGPSGSGKSTLLAIMAGLLKPRSGTVTLEDPASGTVNVAKGDVTWVPQGGYLLPDRSVLDNVLLGALSEGCGIDEASDKAQRALDAVALGHRFDASASDLSGGEAQRVAVARAMCTSRRIVFADEPTASLDRSSAVTVAEVLRGLIGDDRIVVVATHDPLLVERADHVLDLGAP